MSSSPGARWFAVGAVVLVAGGGGLVTVAPALAPAPPAGPGPLEECDAVQVAVYEADAERGDRDHGRYDALTDAQRSVFDEARAAGGEFVRVTDRDRMAAADALPHYVAVDGTGYRANGIRINCHRQPWYGVVLDLGGYVLLGLGVLVGGVAWRRVGY